MSSSCQSSRRDVLSNTATIAAVGLSTLILGADDAMASFKPGPPTAQSVCTMGYTRIPSIPMGIESYESSNQLKQLPTYGETMSLVTDELMVFLL